MIKSYDFKIQKLLSSKPSGTNWKEVFEVHKYMLKMIRHERLIHLLVTIFVGIVMSMSFFVTILSGKLYILFLDVPLFMLFTGYIFHYRFLENTTQNWYKLTGVIKENM